MSPRERTDGGLRNAGGAEKPRRSGATGKTPSVPGERGAAGAGAEARRGRRPGNGQRLWRPFARVVESFYSGKAAGVLSDAFCGPRVHLAEAPAWPGSLSVRRLFSRSGSLGSESSELGRANPDFAVEDDVFHSIGQTCEIRSRSNRKSAAAARREISSACE